MNMPVCSYRLQLTPRFTMHDAALVVPYLRGLGVSHLYLSPVMAAMPDSQHGYDVTDMNILCPARGGEAGFQALVDALPEDMRIILDVVPNHMAADGHNPYWFDVLKNGKASRYWTFFDIFPDADGKIVLPLLAAAPEELWRSGVLRLCKRNGDKVLACGDMFFPLRDGTPTTKTYADIADLQHYRLAKWDENIYTYRRFFHLSALVSLRVEDPAVMDMTHCKLFRLLENCPAIAGIRVDHIDGLADPGEYLARLKKHKSDIWVEKILAREERLPDWKVAGTTGYEFIDALNSLFVHPAGFRHIENWWRKTVAPDGKDFEDCLDTAKKEILERLFPAVMQHLACRFSDAPAERSAFLSFLNNLTATMPVYRVYGYNRQDKKYLLAAWRKMAQRFDPASAKKMRMMLRRFLSTQQKQVYRAWQQVSGGIMAKGLEDCAHYRYTPLAALNEVGCVPVPGDHRPAHFCDFANHRADTQPRGMNTTSTHDTKRSEDVRARLYALADMPLAWIDFYTSFSKQAAPYGLPASITYFFLQAVVGSWPLTAEVPPDYAQRLQDYMVKSACEAGRYTHYGDTDDGFKKQLCNFVGAMLADDIFVGRVEKFMQRLAPCGALNALSALTLKCLSPGIPDIYQGCDLWDFSLVDPDNRRPVDYATRQKMLQSLAIQEKDAAPAARLCRNWRSGLVKMWLTRKLLETRRQYLCGHDISLENVAIDGPCREYFHAYLIYTQKHVLLVVHPLYPGKLSALRNGIGLPEKTCAGISLRLPSLMTHKQGVDVLSGMPVHAGGISEQLLRFPIAVSCFPA